MEDQKTLKRRTFLQWGGAAAMLPLFGCVSRTGGDGHLIVGEKGRDDLWWPGTVPAGGGADTQTLRLRYGHAAAEDRILFEGLPIGNGRLGAMVGGGSQRETLHLNEITLWSGRQEVVDLDYTKEGMGTYLTLGTLSLDFPDHAQADDYGRELDIVNAVARTRYTVGGKTYWRESFCSYPDNVLVMRLASEGGLYNGTVSLVDGQGAVVSGKGDSLEVEGSVSGSGERYATQVAVVAETGTALFDPLHSKIILKDCPALTVIVAARTNYTGRAEKGYLGGKSPALAAAADIRAVRSRPYQDMIGSHIRDYRALFDRMHIDLGVSEASQRALTIPGRLKALERNPEKADPELEALYVQFGRYLTIASSRGPLPANLQGLWNVTNDPPWMADYHNNINLQMNYWLADRAGLPECHQPFEDYVLGQLPSWTRLTHRYFNNEANINYSNSNGKIAGWTIAVSTGVYGNMGWDWSPPANAWHCRTLWNHYQFTLDKAYLERIYPVLRSACEFWQARLIVDPETGFLIDDKDWSSEHGDHQELGITYAQELVWDLFTNTVAANRLLGNKDAAFAKQISELRARLYLPKVSPTTGQLQEWMEDKVNPDDLTHRHLSPLIGWFEGERITPESDPRLVSGVRELLRARGFDSFGWALAWRIACWARFREAQTCYRMVRQLLRFASGTDDVDGSFPNLFDAYGGNIFQIDANFGGPAAILEMLLQSGMKRITLLPALPSQWATGKITGLRAKGGFSVDMSWSQGRLVSVIVTSVGGTSTTLFYDGFKQAVSIPEYGVARFDGALQPV